MVSPSNGSTPGSKVSFDWKREGTAALTLSVVDNRGKTIYRTQVDGVPFKLKQSLRPGLYYWKLQDDNELLYVGKFFMR